MSVLFWSSYALVPVFLLLDAWILRLASREILQLKEMSKPSIENDLPVRRHTLDNQLTFSVRLLGTQDSFTQDDLSSSAILLFFNPRDRSLGGYENFASVVHALWHRSKGHLYLVCEGDEEACAEASNDKKLIAFPDKRVGVVLDSDAALAKILDIPSTPHAVEMGQERKIKRYGRPATLEEVAARFASTKPHLH